MTLTPTPATEKTNMTTEYPPKKIIAILAGSYKEFCNFLAKVKPENGTRYVYVDSPDSIYKKNYSEYKAIGTFYKKKDCRLLEDAVRQEILINRINDY